jgi:hypothetical protein
MLLDPVGLIAWGATASPGAEGGGETTSTAPPARLPLVWPIPSIVM